MGSVAGGVWKSADAGHTWEPIFEDQKVASIGALAIAPSDPNVIYVGTGEACIRGDSSFGDGVYKSIDAGKTWSHVGLSDSRHIGRIVIDPRDPNVVLVAALGHAYGPNSERGIFLSRDGGKAWRKVLYTDEDTGGIDLSMDAQNPRTIFAAMWQVRRRPWTLVSGGAGSGLYRSADGGESWKRVEKHGLPESEWGRVGVSVSPADSSCVYALIESEKGGLYRSDNGGESWALINGDYDLRGRPWYYTQVFAHPRDRDRVFVFSFSAFESSDGGKSFKTVITPHGDYHAVWIDPASPDRMIIGNDGGATISTDAGKTWSAEDNQPTGQFYHIATDNRFHYYLYGSQQDQGTAAIASRTDHGVISEADWYGVGGGESGFVLPSPSDPNVIYAGSLYSTFTRFDKKIDQTRNISPWPVNLLNEPAEHAKYRFGWTAPMVLSPGAPNRLMIGAQMVLESTDDGETWHENSPDLTRNDKSKQKSSGGRITQDNTTVEYFDQIAALAESPRSRETIWAGTDDGLIQITHDGGKSWKNVTPNGVPEWSMISLIDPSPRDPATAYVAVDAHRLDDFRPYIFKTADGGTSWIRIESGLPQTSYVHAVREDPVRRGLLYAGTELGIYVSFDDGRHWQPLQLNLPVTPIYDLVVHGDDLAVGTHGRAFWILDDITPLRQLTPATLNRAFALLRPSKAYRLQSRQAFSGAGLTYGLNPPVGAAIDFFLTAKTKGEVTLEISDQHGNLVRKFQRPGKQGATRVYWDFTAELPGEHAQSAVDEEIPRRDVEVVPGSYQVKLTVGNASETQPLEVALDPRVSVSSANLQRAAEWKKAVAVQQERARSAVKAMGELVSQLDAFEARAKDDANTNDLVTVAEALKQKTNSLIESITGWKVVPHRYSLNYPPALDDSFATLGYAYRGSDAAPNEPAFRVLAELTKRLDAAIGRWRDLQVKDAADFNSLVKKRNVPAVVLPHE